MLSDEHIAWISQFGTPQQQKELSRQLDQRVKEALKGEEGTGSHYDGYTVEEHKRDMEPPPPPPDVEDDELEMRDYDPAWVAQFGSPEQKATMARDLKAQEQETKNIEMTSYDYDPNYGKGLTRGDVRKREGDDGEGTWYAISKHDDDEPYDTSPYTKPSRMIRDNPELKRYHPDYGGIPNRGASRPTPVGAAVGMAAGIRPGMHTGPDRYHVDPRHMR